MKAWRVIITMARLIKLVILTGLLGLLAGVVFLHTGPGMQWLTARIHDAAGDYVRLQGLSGLLPVQLNVDRLEILDSDGTSWLSADHVSARLSAGALLNGQVHLLMTKAERLDWHRVPVYRTHRRSKDYQSFFRRIFRGVYAGQIELDAFQIDPSISGVKLAGRMDGTLNWQAGPGHLRARANADLQIEDSQTIAVGAQLDYQDRQFMVSDMTITMPSPGEDVTLRGRALFRNGQLDRVNVEVDQLDLSLLPVRGEEPPLGGRGRAKLSVTNLIDDPKGELELIARDVNLPRGLLSHADNAQLDIAATLDQHRITARATVTHPRLERFIVDASTELNRSEGLIPLSIDRERGFEVRLGFAANLKELTRSLLNAPMAFGGALEADLSIGQLPGRPVLHGTIAWRDGEFRNASTGTFLDHIQVLLRGTGHQLVVEQGEARDGGAGRVNASGALILDPDWHIGWSGQLDLNKATLFRLIRTDLPLSGRIETTGDREHTRINGELTLEPFRFTIPRRLPPSVRTLDIIEINHPDPSRNTRTVAATVPGQPKRNAFRPVDLNIGITGPHFEVNGRGLKSEWKGSMRLSGNSREPALTGFARVERGYAMLLGRRFTMDEGRIELTGALPPRPQLNISAFTRISDITARLVVSGTTERPVIRLTSDPLLPEEEIMAMVLFGKLIDTMTPWQAIAMANGLRLLSGQDNDIAGVMDASQNLLRVDQIDLKQDEEGEGLASITVGKYLRHDLYVEGEKGFGTAGDVVTLKYDLTPRLVLETETSPRIREGIGLYWRLDY